MITQIAFVVLLVLPLPARGQNPPTAAGVTPVCANVSYRFPLFSSQAVPLAFNTALLRELKIHTVHVRASIADGRVANFDNSRQTVRFVFQLPDDTEGEQQESLVVGTLNLHADYMDRTLLQYSFELFDMQSRVYRLNCSSSLLVTQPRRWIDKVFKGVLPFVIMFISIQMGILLDTTVLRELITRPIQVCIGFTCQYGLMPLIAWSISKIFRYEPVYGLGLFVVGCCPGGAASNQWTVLFDGDLNLSAFMSFASTVASFFMMPFWLYTLGQQAYLQELKIRVPFLNLAQSLLTIIGPLGLGMLLVYCMPKLNPITRRIVKPTLLLIIGYFFVFGACANFYLFRYVDLVTALTAPLLPWLGFILGSGLAWVCRQDWSRIKTIGIETGIQNVGIAFLVLLHSLPAPENSQSCVIPLLVAYMSAQPFYVILIYRFLRRKRSKPEPLDPRVSADTLSQTTRHLSEDGGEAGQPNDSAKVAIPLVVAGMAAESDPVKV